MENRSFDSPKEIKSTDDSIGQESSSSRSHDFIQRESKRIQKEEGGASAKNKAKIGDKVKRDGHSSSHRLWGNLGLTWGCLSDKPAVHDPSKKQGIGRLQKENRSFQERREQYSKKITETKKNTKKSKHQLQELEQQLQQSEQQLQQSEQYNQTLDQQFQELEQHNQNLEQQLQQSEQHNQNLEQQFQQSEQHNQTLEQQLQQSEQRYQNLEQQFQQSEQHNQTLEQRFQQSEQHNQELTQENQDLQDILRRLPPPNVPIISADGTVKHPGGWEEKLFSTLFEGREERIQKRLEDLDLWKGTYSDGPYTIDRNTSSQKSGTDPLVNLGQKHLEESSPENSPQNSEKVRFTKDQWSTSEGRHQYTQGQKEVNRAIRDRKLSTASDSESTASNENEETGPSNQRTDTRWARLKNWFSS